MGGGEGGRKEQMKERDKIIGLRKGEKEVSRGKRREKN